MTMTSFFLGLILLAGQDTVPGALPPAPQAQPSPDPRALERLGLKELPKSTKITELESKATGRRYWSVVDEKAAAKVGLDPKAVKEAIRRALDGRQDAREDGMVSIDLEEDDAAPEAGQRRQERSPDAVGPPPVPPPRKVMVARMRARDPPKDAYQAGSPDDRRVEVDEDITLRITASGACASQNSSLLKEFKLPFTYT